MGQNKSKFQEYKREQKLNQNREKIQGLTTVLTVTAEQEQLRTERGWTEQEHKKQSMKMLKSMFSQLDGGVVQTKGAVQGRVQLSVKFDSANSLLIIRLVRCVGLRSRDVRSPVCDPCVKFWLLPDPSNQGVKCSNPARLTCDPVYNELFAFNVKDGFLSTSKLFLEVWDHDVTKHAEFLGQSLVSLSDLDLTNQLQHTFWAPLNVKRELNITGDLNLSVVYNQTMREKGEEHVLSITVHGATGLAASVHNQPINCHVEVILPGTPVKFLTQSVPLQPEPEWEELFQCNIKPSDFEKRFILLNVKSEGGEDTERSLGQAVLFLSDLNPEEPYQSSLQLSDMRNSELLQEKLSQDPATLELQEALQAHAVFANPSFLFQKHTGNKVITLKARKAGSQAAVRLQDGIPVY